MVWINIHTQTSISTTIVPLDLNTCGREQKLIIDIQSISGATNFQLESTLPSEFTFHSLIPASGISILDTSNKELPLLQIASIPAGTTKRVQFRVRAKCGATSGSVSFQLKNSSGTNVGSPVVSSTININKPNLLLSGTVNTDLTNQSGINLSQLAVGDKYIRTYRIEYTSAVGRLDSLTLLIEKPYHNLIWSSSGTASLSSTGDSVYYKFDRFDFGGSPLSPSNNVFIFSDTVEVKSCPLNTLAINAEVELSWGCYTEKCQNVNITALGSLAGDKPIISYVSQSANLTNFCQTTSSYKFTVKNTQNLSGNNADIAYNLVIHTPFVRNNSNTYNPSSFPNTIIFDSVTINGVNVPFDQGLHNYYPQIDSLTASDYNGGGLVDLNNDGFLNDLPYDSSLTIEVFYRNIPPTHTCGLGSTGRKIIYFYAHKGLYIDFEDMCGEPMTQFRRQQSYQYLDFNSRTFTGDAISSDGIPFKITFNEWAQFARFDWTKVRLEKRFIVPKGVSFGTPLNISWYGVTNNGSVNYSTVVKPGTTHDTLSVFTDRMRGNNNSDDNFTIDLVNNCALNIDQCADLVIKAESYVHIDSGDITQPCYISPIGCGSISVIKDCGVLVKGFNVIDQSLNRATFGWTDSTRTTKVNENTPGVILDKAHPYDSIKLDLTIITKDTAHSNFLVDFEYDHGPSTTDPLKEIPGSHVATITDVSSGNTFTFPITAITKTTISATKKKFQLDLSGLVNNMRTSLLNPLYLFGGDVGSSTYSADTIRVNFYVYSDRLADYSINGSIISGSSNAEIAASPPCIYKGVNIYIDHEAERLARHGGYGNWFSCSRVWYAGAGFSYLDAGATQSPANSLIGNFDPVEYKPYTSFDSIEFTWDESVWFLDTAAGFYSARGYYGSYSITPPQGYPIPNKFVNVKSGSNVVIRMDSIYKRYGQGVRDHLQAVIPLRNACNRDLAVRTGINRINWTAYRKYYPQAYGGPITANAVSTIAYSSPTRILPIQTLTNIVPNDIANKDTVEWVASIFNTHPSEIMSNTWIDLRSPSGNITPVVVTDGTTSYPVLTHAGGYWCRLGNIPANTSISYTIKSTYTSCFDDSLILNTSYNCAQYPTDPSQGYPENGYSCNDDILSTKFYLSDESPLLQNTLTNQPPDTINLCDTVSYTLFGQNANTAPAVNLRQKLTLPTTSTFLVIAGSSELEWPANSGNWVSISDPTLAANIYEWDLSSNFISGKLPGTGIPLDSNKFNIRYDILTGCPFTTGDQLSFSIEGEKICGQVVQSPTLVSKPIFVRGLPPSPNNIIINDFTVDTLNMCNDSAEILINILNAVGGPSNGKEKIILEIQDTNLHIGTIYDTINGSLLKSLLPSDSNVFTTKRYEWELKSGLLAGDSIVFKIKIAANNYTLLDCKKLPISIKTIETHDITCLSDSTVCGVNFNIDVKNDSIVIDKGNIIFKSVYAYTSLCVDSVSVDMNIQNIGALIPNGTNSIIKFAVDKNNNATYDLGDSLLTGQEYVITDSLNTLDSLLINHKIFIPNSACKVTAFIDTINCICDSSFHTFDIDFIPGCDSIGPGCILDSLMLWLRADKGVVLSGTNVTSWTDIISNRTFTNFSANRAQFVNQTSQTFNFHPYIDFSTNNAILYDSIFKGNIVAGNDVTIIAVRISGATNETSFAYQNKNSEYFSCRNSDYILSNTENININTSNIIPQIIGANANVAGSQFKVINNGAITIDGTTGTTAATINPQHYFTIGGETDGTTISNSFTGKIAEIIMYNRRLTDNEIGRIMSYLGIKYGITIPVTYRM